MCGARTSIGATAGESRRSGVGAGAGLAPEIATSACDRHRIFSATRRFDRIVQAIAQATNRGDHVGTQLLANARDEYLDGI